MRHKLFRPWEVVVGVLLILANWYYLANIGNVNPILLAIYAWPGILFAVHNALCRFLFTGVVFVEGMAAFMACDLGSGPSTAFHHTVHEMSTLIELYGFGSGIVMLIQWFDDIRKSRSSDRPPPPPQLSNFRN